MHLARAALAVGLLLPLAGCMHSDGSLPRPFLDQSWARYAWTNQTDSGFTEFQFTPSEVTDSTGVWQDGYVLSTTWNFNHGFDYFHDSHAHRSGFDACLMPLWSSEGRSPGFQYNASQGEKVLFVAGSSYALGWIPSFVPLLAGSAPDRHGASFDWHLRPNGKDQLTAWDYNPFDSDEPFVPYPETPPYYTWEEQSVVSRERVNGWPTWMRQGDQQWHLAESRSRGRPIAGCNDFAQEGHLDPFDLSVGRRATTATPPETYPLPDVIHFMERDPSLVTLRLFLAHPDAYAFAWSHRAHVRTETPDPVTQEWLVGWTYPDALEYLVTDCSIGEAAGRSVILFCQDLRWETSWEPVASPDLPWNHLASYDGIPALYARLVQESACDQTYGVSGDRFDPRADGYVGCAQLGRPLLHVSLESGRATELWLPSGYAWTLHPTELDGGTRSSRPSCQLALPEGSSPLLESVLPAPCQAAALP